MLKPNLGHPNMAAKLDELNQMELNRQETYQNNLNTFINDLKTSLEKHADSYFRDLARTNESLLIKFDDILTEDEILKHGWL